MSLNHKRDVSFLKVATDPLPFTRLIFDGVGLSSDQRLTVLAAFQQFIAISYQTLCNSLPTNENQILLTKVFSFLCQSDLHSVGLMLKDCVSFLRNVDTQNHQSYVSFKHSCSTMCPGCEDFFAPIDVWMWEILESHSPVAFTLVNQYFSFLTRLDIGIDFSDASLEDWVCTEERLRTISYDLSCVRIMTNIVTEWFEGFSFDEYSPSHGPGSVAERKGKPSIYEKYTYLHSDMRINYFYHKLGIDPSDDLIPADLDASRINSVQFVPKSLTTGRVVSKEPSVLQFIQHGVYRCIDRHIRRHYSLNKHIRLHEQEYNAKFAQVGSCTVGSYATIDLSSASDTVSWELVKKLFRHTSLLPALLACRSTHTLLPSGEMVEIRKHAPMGSALCFPIMTLVFAAICEYASRFSGIHSKNLSYCVYGDDIVIDERLVDTLMLVLHQLGFKLNESKSFHGSISRFREACGGEYYRGEDVRPLRISRKFSHAAIQSHPALFDEYISAANDARIYGFKHLRSWYVGRLLALPVQYRPLFSDERNGILSDSYSNFHLKSVFVKKYQSYYVKCGRLSSRLNSDQIVDPELLESIRKYEWFRQARFRSTPTVWPEDRVSPEIREFVSVLASNLVLKPLYK